MVTVTQLLLQSNLPTITSWLQLVGYTRYAEVGVSQNSSQVALYAFSFSACAICVALYAFFFSACAICVALYAFFFSACAICVFESVNLIFVELLLRIFSQNAQSQNNF